MWAKFKINIHIEQFVTRYYYDLYVNQHFTPNITHMYLTEIVSINKTDLNCFRIFVNVTL